MVHRTALLVLLAGLAGCGRSPLNLPPTGAGGVGAAGVGAAGAPDDSSLSTGSAFCVAYEAIFSDAAPRCFGAPVPADAEAAVVAAECTSIDAVVAAGRASYDRAGAAACLAEVRATWAASCRFDDVPCVNQVVAGTLPDGAACTVSAECQGESICDRPDHSTCSPMVCTPKGGVGDRCDDGCEAGLVCANDGSDLCVVDSGVTGAPCDPTQQDACDFTFSCQPSGRGGSQCVATATGDACADDFSCPAEDFCSAVGTCQARLRIGASCAGQRSGCVALAACDETGACVAAGVANGPCGENGFCFAGACATLGDPPVCLVMASAGAPCDDPAQCASGVCANNQCVACAP